MYYLDLFYPKSDVIPVRRYGLFYRDFDTALDKAWEILQREEDVESVQVVHPIRGEEKVLYEVFKK